jgi:hypothetical protein
MGECDQRSQYPGFGLKDLELKDLGLTDFGLKELGLKQFGPKDLGLKHPRRGIPFCRETG